MSNHNLLDGVKKIGTIFGKENRESFQREEEVKSPPAAYEIESSAIKAGWLYKRGGGKKSQAWKKRWFILSGINLYYYKTEKEKNPRGWISNLSYFEIHSGEDDQKNNRFAFYLSPKLGSTEVRTYFIYASTRAEKLKWMEVLRNVSESPIFDDILKSYNIPADDLEWGGDEIGKGASGVVTKGKWLRTTDVAIKRLNNLPEFTDQEEMTSFYHEIETLSQLRHPNIVPMFGYSKKDKYLCLVTEYVKGGNLSQSIHNPKILMDIHLIVELSLSISRGMVYLHNKSVIHRDLKPGNILVENLKEAKVKVCDFGLSTITKGKAYQNNNQQQFGSPAYAAPELPIPSHNEKVDIFSFAVIMWEISTRQRVWENVSHVWQISERVSKGERLPLAQGNILNSLIKKCWDQDPEKRPSFAQIYEELEEIKASLPPRQKPVQTESPTVSDQKENQLTLEELILSAFGKDESLPWTEFSQSLNQISGATIPTIEKMKSILTVTDQVFKEHWKTFIQWFTPLVQTDFYQTEVSGQNQISTEGYQIEEVADIVGPNWFFGFIDAQKAKELLSTQPVGTFLFRFSKNQPGIYSISVNYGQVGHWRISSEKTGSSYPIFRIDGRPYKSLYHIIETHSLGGEPLQIKAGSTTRQCYLTKPLDRIQGKIQVYEDMY